LLVRSPAQSSPLEKKGNFFINCTLSPGLPASALAVFCLQLTINMRDKSFFAEKGMHKTFDNYQSGKQKIIDLSGKYSDV
jgi:hypothetical protein